MKTSGTHRTLIALWAAVVLALVGGVAYAAIPGADGEIDACYTAGTGQLRVVDGDAGDVCRQQETALTWNQTGPRGPSDGYIASLPTAAATPLPRLGTTNVISLSLPAGDYILSSSVHVRRVVAGSSTVSCDHRVGGGPFQIGYSEHLDGDGDVATIALTAGVSLESAQTVHVSCFTDADGNRADLADLAAVAVGTLNRQ